MSKRNFLSPIINERIPSFVQTEYPDFHLFLNHYFEFLEEQGNPLEVLENFLYSIEANNEVDIYIDKILQDLGYDITLDPTIPKSELVVHLRDFYLGRGNENSVKFLFKVIFGEQNASVGYPRERLLTTSQASYTGRYYLYTTSQNQFSEEYFNVLLQSADYNIIAEGVVSGAIAGVESINSIVSNNTYYLQIQIDSPLKGFSIGEPIKIYNEDGTLEIFENVVNVIGISIDDPGYGYAIGDLITITGPNVAGLAKVRTLIEGSIEDITITNGGQNYRVGDSIYAVRQTKGHSFSAAVKAIDSSNNYLQTPAVAGLQLETGDFTIETWIHKTVVAEEIYIIGNTDGWEYVIDAENRAIFRFVNGDTVSSNVTIPGNRWTHIVVQRDGNTISHYTNGIRTGEATVSDGTVAASNIRIGADNNGIRVLTGYMDELRVSSIARYDSLDFEVQTEGFTDDGDTELLLKFDGVERGTTFTDSSSNALPITQSGSVRTTLKQTIFNDSTAHFVNAGAITQIKVYSPGYNYDKLPTLRIRTQDGSGAILVPSSETIGQIESIEYIEPYVDLANLSSAVITVTSEEGTGAVLSATQQAIFTEGSTHKSFEGFLEINSNLLDSYYWQQFSYEIRSSISRDRYNSIVDEYIHPTGFVRFAVFEVVFSELLDTITSNSWITIVKLLFGLDVIPEGLFDAQYRRYRLLFNPIINIHRLKDSNYYRNPNYEFDAYTENMFDYTNFYVDQALDAVIIRHMDFTDVEILFNPLLNLERFKASSNFEHANSIWANETMASVHDKTRLMHEALSAEYSTVYMESIVGTDNEADLDVPAP